MQIRLSTRNLELLEMEGVELKNKSINEYFEELLSMSTKQSSSGFKDDLMKELNEIKSLVKGNSSWQKRDYVISDKSSPYNPVTQVTPVTIANHPVVQTGFGAKVKKSWTEKQEVLLQTAYTDIMSGVTQDGFKVGDDTTYVFERLYVWMTGDIREELKERVKKGLEEKANEIDYTLFIF